MRVWIDISNSPQVPFFRPLVALLRERGHDVEVTTREYAQTVELLEAARHPSRGRRPPTAAPGRLARPRDGRPLRALRDSRSGAGSTRPLACVARASPRRPLARHPLRVRVRLRARSHSARLGCRAARRVVVPEAIPQDRLDRLGARATKVRRYPGLKEEYYLHGFEPDDSVLDGARARPRARPRRRAHATRRIALPPARKPAVRSTLLERLGRDESVRAVVLPRTAEQRNAIRARDAAVAPSCRSTRRRAEPRRARRSRRLGRRDDEPRGGRARRPGLHDVCGRLGAVDSALVNEGRLRVLTSRDTLVVEKRSGSGSRSSAIRRSARPAALGARAVARLSRSG